MSVGQSVAYVAS